MANDKLSKQHDDFIQREILRRYPNVKVRDSYIPAWNFPETGWVAAFVSEASHDFGAEVIIEEAEFLSEGHHMHTGKIMDAKVFKSELEAVVAACGMSANILYGRMEVWKGNPNSFRSCCEAYVNVHLEGDGNQMSAAATHVESLYPSYE